ncbi:collagen-binding domain-containing protein [Paenibacillus camerounensis]|uniref:collagen-binding domain-containing protein n=1 Tax=Paenibacillus camerounensis TaxID=1243663 RepID=UPI000693B95B|nr:collagen-binding domain-containing protein [Paenibacillus camerounensis]
MKRIKKKRLYFVSGLALVMLLVLPVWKLMTYVVADQTIGYVVKANMTLNRTITNENGTIVTENDNLQINKNIVLNYTITPLAVPDSNTAGIQQQAVTNLVFTEKLPPNLNIQDTSLPAGFTKTGNLSTGYTLTGTLPDLTYSWNQSKQAFVANADTGQTSKVISFSVPAQVTNTGSYIFNKAGLNFNDIHSSVTATPSPSPAAAFNPDVSSTGSLLGVAGDYNVFVFEGAKITASVAGNIAAGGNVTTGGVSINEGYRLTVPYALVTGGDLNFTNGTVYGNILHQGEYLKNYPGNIVGGTYKKGSLIDFASARSYYEAYSSKLAAIQAAGTTTELKYGGLYATATQPVSVFDFTSDYYNQASWTNLTAPAGSSLIFNVRGANVNFTKAFALPNGVSGNNVIYNFPDATSVSISSGEYRGSILAPKAAITFTNGQIHGNIIGKSIDSSSTVGILPYTGQMPPTTTPTPTPAVTASPTPAPSRATLEFVAISIKVIRPVTEIRMEGATLVVGETKLLNPTVMPSNASITALRWSSADPTIATVSQSGQVTGVKEGTARITVSATDGSGVSRTVDVIVKKVPVTEIQLEGTILILGESKALTATVIPSNATSSTLQWSSANSGIVTVDQTGQVTGITVGKTQITASATDGSNVSRTVDVIVKKVAVEVTDIQLEGTTLTVNETKLLNATISPSNASIPVLEWSSNNTSIVTVDQNGRVTGVAEGTAQITAKATDGSDISKTVNVTVTAPRALEIGGGTSTQINKALDLKAIYTGPAGETGINYTWTIVSGPPGATLAPATGEDTTFKAPSLGEYIIKLSFTSHSLAAPIEVLKQISVTKIPLTDFNISGANQVYAGRNLSLSLGLDPVNAGIEASDIIWSITGDDNGTYASLSNTDITKLGNTLVAKTFKKDPTTGAALETKVTVTARIGSIEKSLVVDILPMVLRFSKSTHVLSAGENSNLADLLYLYPYDIPLNKLEWTSSNNAIASFTNIHDGTITAHAPGIVKVTVTYKPSEYTDPVSATIVIQVKLPDNKDKY